VFAAITNAKQRDAALNARPRHAGEGAERSYPKWAGAPAGGPLVLVDSPAVSVAVSRVTAFPAGWDFTLIVRTEEADAARRALLPDWPEDSSAVRGRDEVFRFGLRFGDGTVAVDPTNPYVRAADGLEIGASLSDWAGKWADRGVAGTTYWVSPLPPPGAVEFVCEWAEQGLVLTSASLDGETIHRASEATLPIAGDRPS
jgi:hypothetical protein